MTEDVEIAGKVAGTILQKHGGALLARGVKGHRGGPGRPPSEIRQRCADSFDKHVRVAVTILRSEDATNGDKLKALDLLGKYGGLIKTETETTIKRPHREAVEKARREIGLAS